MSIRSERASIADALAERFRKIEVMALAKKDIAMLWTIIGLLILLWLIGLIAHVGGALIHLLLVIAVIVFLVRLITGRSAV